MTMTNEQIDELVMLAACGATETIKEQSRRSLATALKSAIQDSGRIEWLESQKRFDCPWQGENSIVFNWPDGTEIREAIDARMKGEGA